MNARSRTICGDRQTGFTLIEILVVIVLIAVASALIIPDYFVASSKTPRDDAERLYQALRLAGEEAVLGGKSLRFSAWPDHYRFQQSDDAGVWTPLFDPPFQPWSLTPGIVITDITQPGLPATDTQDSASAPEKGKPPLASITFRPDGGMESSRIRIAASGDPAGDVTIEVHPGPNGIRLQSDQQSEVQP